MRQNEPRGKCGSDPSARRPALRTLADMVVWAADEAPNRDSELHLRDAAARIFDALSAERRVLL